MEWTHSRRRVLERCPCRYRTLLGIVLPCSRGSHRPARSVCATAMEERVIPGKAQVLESNDQEQGRVSERPKYLRPEGSGSGATPDAADEIEPNGS